MSALHVTDNEFEQKVLKSSLPVLVDFWAEWCGPCRQVAPVLDEIAKEKAGAMTVAKVDIDKNPGTPQKYGVRGIPTLILFKNGQAVSTKVGSLPKSKLIEWINSVIAA
jgi:thioredoxin 1